MRSGCRLPDFVTFGPMFAALGRIASRRPWIVIGVWIVVAIAIVASAPNIETTNDQSDFLPHHYESIKATELVDDAFPQQETAGATIVFSKTDGSAMSLIEAALGPKSIMEKVDLPSDFSKAEDPQTPPNGGGGQGVKAVIVNLDLADNVTGQTQAELDQIGTLRDELNDAAAGTGLQAQVTGDLAQTYDSSQQGQNAEKIVGIATIGLIIVLLAIIFRSVLITFMPIVLVGLVSGIANGLIDWAAKLFHLQTTDSTAIILIVVLFGIGTDYILFFLFRYRERLREVTIPAEKSGRREVQKGAVAHAVSRAGEAIASAGGAVFVAFMTLVLSSLGIFRSIGPSLAIAVAVTLVAAITLVPAVVTVLGKALFWPSRSWRRESKGSRFAWIGGQVGKHPGRTAITSGLLLVILAIFAVSFHPNFNLDQTPTDSESSIASEKMIAAGFSAGATQPTPVVLHSTDGQKLTTDEVDAFATKMSTADGVGAVADAHPISQDGQTALVIVTLTDSPTSDAAIDDVKDGVRPAAHAAAPDGTEAYVGGISSVFLDFQKAMNRDYSIVFPVAAVIIMIILGLLLRSLVAPWYLMASVGLGFGATLGATVLVFQDIKGDSGLIFLLPIYIYLFVVALGTDYNILMISRLREEAREGKSPREAAAEAVKHAGPTIAAAGLILAGTFASLMLAGQSLLSTMGFAISFGIVMAAFVMSMFFTPALTALIGHAAWWPGHADEAKPELASHEN